MTQRRALLAMLLAGAFMAPALAQGVGPSEQIVALDSGLLAVMQAGKATPFAQRVAMLLPTIQRTFALDAVLAASVGPRFADFPPAAKANLLAAFTDFTVASYVANFNGFSGEKFPVDPQTRAVGADQVVHSRIVPRSGDPTTIDYVMRQMPAGWQVVDVLLDGSISRVAVQRSDFRSLLGSGSAAPLIASLRKRAAALAAHG